MQLLSGFCCYSNLVCLFGFWVEKSVATCSSKVKVEHAHLVAFRSCTNLVPRIFRLFRQRGNAWKTLGTSNLNRRNPAVLVVLRMPQFLNGSKILRAVRDSEGAMFHVKCFRKVATATLHEIYPSFSEEQEYILAILFYVCYPFGNCSFIMLQHLKMSYPVFTSFSARGVNQRGFRTYRKKTLKQLACPRKIWVQRY